MLRIESERRQYRNQYPLEVNGVNLAKFLSSASALSLARTFSVSDYVEFLHTRESERDVTMSSGMAVAAQTEGVGGGGKGRGGQRKLCWSSVLSVSPRIIAGELLFSLPFAHFIVLCHIRTDGPQCFVCATKCRTGIVAGFHHFFYLKKNSLGRPRFFYKVIAFSHLLKVRFGSQKGS